MQFFVSTFVSTTSSWTIITFQWVYRQNSLEKGGSYLDKLSVSKKSKSPMTVPQPFNLTHDDSRSSYLLCTWEYCLVYTCKFYSRASLYFRVLNSYHRYSSQKLGTQHLRINNRLATKYNAYLASCLIPGSLLFVSRNFMLFAKMVNRRSTKGKLTLVSKWVLTLFWM